MSMESCGVSFVASSQTTLKFSAADDGDNVEVVKFEATAVDSTPPTVPVLTPSTTDPGAFVSGSTVFYRSSVASTSGFTVGASTTEDRKSTRLNSSHLVISYAVFCLKKKTPFSRTYGWTLGASSS